MTVFAIISPPTNAKMPAFKAAVQSAFPDGSCFEIAEGQFAAVAEGMTALDASRKIVPDGSDAVGFFVVFSTLAFYGWHRVDLWEWLETRGANR